MLQIKWFSTGSGPLVISWWCALRPFWSRARFTIDFSITIQIQWKLTFILIQSNCSKILHMTRQLCWRCFCKNIVAIWLTWNWISAKRNFHRIWIVIDELLVKWPQYCLSGWHFLRARQTGKAHNIRWFGKRDCLTQNTFRRSCPHCTLYISAPSRYTKNVFSQWEKTLHM